MYKTKVEGCLLPRLPSFISSSVSPAARADCQVVTGRPSGAQNLLFCSTQQSLCSEMAEELRFAVRCRASRQRPALRRQCSKCLPTTAANTYVPSAMDLHAQENGIMQMLEMRKSPLHFDCTDS